MHRLKSVGVLSVAKVSGLIYGALGLLIVPFFIVIALATSLASKQMPSGSQIPAAFGPIFAIVMAILAPLLYGIMGFVTGAVSALIYNLIAGWVGGIEMELEIAPIAQPVLPVPTPMPPLPQPPLA